MSSQDQSAGSVHSLHLLPTLNRRPPGCQTRLQPWQNTAQSGWTHKPPDTASVDRAHSATSLALQPPPSTTSMSSPAPALVEYETAIARALAMGPRRPAILAADLDVTERFYEDLAMEVVRRMLLTGFRVLTALLLCCRPSATSPVRPLWLRDATLPAPTFGLGGLSVCANPSRPRSSPTVVSSTRLRSQRSPSRHLHPRHLPVP